MSQPAPSRRNFIGGALALGLVPSGAFGAATSRLIAGTYDNDGGKGLVPLTAGGQRWSAGAANGAIRNASFGVSGKLRYLLDEQTQGALSIYNASLRRVGGGSTLGADPCHAALSADRTQLAVANYSSGDVALWQLDPATGLPEGEPQRIAHEGRGPNAERQAGPHAHWVGFTRDGRILHSVDLGADTVFAHRLGAQVQTDIAYRAAPGSGPRHLARHPRLPVAYLVTELANTITALTARPDGTFAEKRTLSTLPTGFRGNSAVAHIALNRAGTRLYVSNRGHDSIAVFAIQSDGSLQPIQHVGCGGHWPRFFLLMEDRGVLLVANQRSGNVATLQLGRDGRLASTKRSVAVPGVAFLST